MARMAVARRTVKLPEGVQVSLDGDRVSVKGPKGELSRVLEHVGIGVQVEAGKVLITRDHPRRADKAVVGTLEAHLANMVKGVTQGFEYRMKTVYSHFPIKTSVKGDAFVVENFLGERHPRKATILAGVKVEAKGENVTVTGTDREAVGQTAANIEHATRVRRRDSRVFQDGIYIVSRGG